VTENYSATLQIDTEYTCYWWTAVSVYCSLLFTNYDILPHFHYVTNTNKKLAIYYKLTINIVRTSKSLAIDKSYDFLLAFHSNSC